MNQQRGRTVGGRDLIAVLEHIIGCIGFVAAVSRLIAQRPFCLCVLRKQIGCPAPRLPSRKHLLHPILEPLAHKAMASFLLLTVFDLLLRAARKRMSSDCVLE